jgi:hypothetical protein
MKERYPLARVGNGRKTHVLDANGRVRCESSGTWTYLTQDADGRYGDETLTSAIHPLGTIGHPSCHWCRQATE